MAATSGENFCRTISNVQAPCAGDQDLALWHLAQHIFKNGEAGDVLRLVAMLRVQDSIEIQ